MVGGNHVANTEHGQTRRQYVLDDVDGPAKPTMPVSVTVIGGGNFVADGGLFK